MSLIEFYNELDEKCPPLGIDAREVKQKLSEFIGLDPECIGLEAEELAELIRMHGGDKIVAHYLTPAPIPQFPEIKLDVFLVTGSCLYNYAIPLEGEALLSMLPLGRIGYISQRISGDFISLVIHSGSGMNLMLQEKISARNSLDRFYAILTKAVLGA